MNALARNIDQEAAPEGMAYTRTEMIDGKPVRCFIEVHPAKARRTDPKTSKDAAKSVEDITYRQNAVLFALRTAGPSTHQELVVKYNEIIVCPTQTEQSIRSRCAELVRLGKVEDTHLRRKTVHGRNSIVWKAVN